MPAYNCQRQFVKPILRGEKPHTIRRGRKHPTKVGDELKLYIGMRTKACKLFAKARCTSIQPVVIYPWKGELWMVHPEHDILCPVEDLGALARADGFEDVGAFFDFFKRYKRECLDDFEIIYWDPKELKAYLSLEVLGEGLLGAHPEVVIVDEVLG